jgi:N-acetylmuramoyl-L-alanine amidase
MYYLSTSTASSPGRARWPAITIALVLTCVGLWLFHIGRTGGSRVGGAEKIVVCIDPGHPSETNSARRVINGTSEVYINWVVGLKLQSILEQDPRIRVVRTKITMDQLVHNRDRAILANDNHAALAIHLHCDAGPNHGFTIYYPDRQGRSLGKVGPDVKVLGTSFEAAESVHKGMCDVLCGILKDRGVKGESFTKYGRRYGGLTTSIWSEVPTITVEMVFLNNRYDARFIKTGAGQEAMAQALAKGIKDYIQPQLKAYDGVANR